MGSLNFHLHLAVMRHPLKGQQRSNGHPGQPDSSGNNEAASFFPQWHEAGMVSEEVC